jgi:hypothetical protein
VYSIFTYLIASKDWFDKGDFDFGSSSRFSSADTEKASEFFGICGLLISVLGECVILGGGGESTSSSSDDDEFERDRSLECDRDLLLLRLLLDFMLKFEIESANKNRLELSHTLAWRPLTVQRLRLIHIVIVLILQLVLD